MFNENLRNVFQYILWYMNSKKNFLLIYKSRLNMVS